MEEQCEEGTEASAELSAHPSVREADLLWLESSPALWWDVSAALRGHGATLRHGGLKWEAGPRFSAPCPGPLQDRGGRRCCIWF